MITFHYRTEDESIDECDCTEEGFKTHALALAAGEKRLKQVEEQYKKDTEGEEGNESYHTMRVCVQVSGHYEPDEESETLLF